MAQIGQMTLIAVIQFEVIMSDLRMVHSGATHLLHILDHLPVHKLPHPVKRVDRMDWSPPRSSLIDEGEDDPHQWIGCVNALQVLLHYNWEGMLLDRRSKIIPSQMKAEDIRRSSSLEEKIDIGLEPP